MEHKGNEAIIINPPNTVLLLLHWQNDLAMHPVSYQEICPNDWLRIIQLNMFRQPSK